MKTSFNVFNKKFVILFSIIGLFLGVFNFLLFETSIEKNDNAELFNTLGFDKVVSSSNTYFGFKDEDEVYAWGDSSLGQFGNGTNAAVNSTPILVASNDPINSQWPFEASEIRDIYVFMDTIFAFLDTNEVYAWGRGAWGQLGNGVNIETNSTPILVASDNPTTTTTQWPFKVSQISEFYNSGNTIFAFLDTNEVYAWGVGNVGQFGNGTNNLINSTPILVASDNPIVSQWPFSVLQIDEFYSTGDTVFVFLDTNEIYGWGFGGNGQLGNGTNVYSNSTPILVASDNPIDNQWSFEASQIIEFYVFGNTIFAFLDTNEVYAWGDGNFGQFGNGNDNHTSTNSTPILVASNNPVAIQWPFKVSEIKEFYNFGNTMFAFLENNDVYGWGFSGNGQLGNGTSNGMNLEPILVASDNPTVLEWTFKTSMIDQFQSTGTTMFVFLENGDVFGWGGGAYGQMGNGTSSGTNSTPTITPWKFSPNFDPETSSNIGMIIGITFASIAGLGLIGYGFYYFKNKRVNLKKET